MPTAAPECATSAFQFVAPSTGGAPAATMTACGRSTARSAASPPGSSPRCASTSTAGRRSPPIAGGAIDTEEHRPARRGRRPLRRPSGPGPMRRPGPGSSSSPTSAGSTPTTRSSPCASPSTASTRSPSTTSAARPASACASGPPISTSCATSARPGTRSLSWPTSRPPSSALRALGPESGSGALHDRLLLRRAARLPGQHPGPRPGRGDRVLRLADRRARRHPGTGRLDRPDERADPRASSAAPTAASPRTPWQSFEDALAAAGRAARARDLPGCAALASSTARPRTSPRPRPTPGGDARVHPDEHARRVSAPSGRPQPGSRAWQTPADSRLMQALVSRCWRADWPAMHLHAGDVDWWTGPRARADARPRGADPAVVRRRAGRHRARRVRLVRPAERRRPRRRPGPSLGRPHRADGRLGRERRSRYGPRPRSRLGGLDGDAPSPVRPGVGRPVRVWAVETAHRSSTRLVGRSGSTRGPEPGFVHFTGHDASST